MLDLGRSADENGPVGTPGEHTFTKRSGPSNLIRLALTVAIFSDLSGLAGGLLREEALNQSLRKSTSNTRNWGFSAITCFTMGETSAIWRKPVSSARR
jgi:hypothetical protein